MESPTGVARVSNVRKAIARLPLRKASGLDGLSAEHASMVVVFWLYTLSSYVEALCSTCLGNLRNQL